MPEIKVTINSLEKLQLSARLVDVVEEKKVVDRKVMTTVRFDYEGTPMLMNQVLLALANEHHVSAYFDSPQAVMSLDEVGTSESSHE